MRRGKTPAKSLTMEGIDLTGYSFEVALKQGNLLITKPDEVCDLTVTEDEGVPTSVIDFSLDQEETLKLRASDVVQIQVRYISSDGAAGATSIARERVDDILRDGVIVYD